jgi:protein-S-isoprenylcysteine O-methyltransferase Ste14
MNTDYLIILGLCLLGLLIRTSYEILKKRGSIDTKNVFIFLFVFVAMCMMLGSWPAMCPIDPWRIIFPSFIRWIGYGITTVAIVMAIIGIIQLRGLENIDHLVTSGLYSKIRHPMYTGFILWIIGWILSYGAMASFAVGLVAISNILYWGHLEEKALVSQYGEKYLNYRKKTWF